MLRPSSTMSVTVWMMATLVLVDCFSHTSADDDQDGPPSQRSNSTLSGLTMNQAGRLPLSNNNFSPFSRFQQPSPFGSPFQGIGGLSLNNGFPQQNGFLQQIPQQNGFQQTGFQQNGFPQNGFQQNGFPQNGFQQLGNIPQQQNGGLIGQGTQFSSIGLQNQLGPQQLGLQNQFGSQLGLQSQFGSQLGLQSQLGAQMGFQNQLGGNSFQNQLALQNQLAQNPFELSLLQQNQLSLQNQLALKNQLGLQNQFGIQNPAMFGLQNPFGLQNQLGQQQPNPFGLQQQLGSSAGLLNNDVIGGFAGNPQLGSSGLRFGQNGFGNFPQSNNNNNGFTGSSLGTGSSSSLLLSGGQFQDSSSSSGNNQFGNQNRFPFSNTFSNSNRLAGNSNNGVLGGPQFAGSQFSNQFSDPFLGQRPQLSSFETQQQQRPFRDGGFSQKERSMSFNDTFDAGFQQAQQRQPQQQIELNPYLAQLGLFNRQQPFVQNQFSSPFVQQPRQPLKTFDQQQQQLGSSPFSSSLNQQQSLIKDSSFAATLNQQQQEDVDDTPFSSFHQIQKQQNLKGESNNQRPSGNQHFNSPQNGPFGNGVHPQDFASNPTATNNPSSDQRQPTNGVSSSFIQSQQPQQQSFPLPIPVTGFSCDGRPPGYYADMKNGCRTFHICISDGSESGIKRSFACPNGTLFDQVNTVCQWKDDVDCSKSQLFYPRPAASSTVSPSSLQNGGDIRPTTSPFNTQIPSPVDHNNFHRPPTTPSGLIFSGVGQPSPAMGSLDAGRSLDDTRRLADDNSAMRPTRNLFSPPQIRPSLFRPSEQLDDHRRA